MKRPMRNDFTAGDADVYSLTKEEHDRLMLTRVRPVTQAPVMRRRRVEPNTVAAGDDVLSSVLARLEADGPRVFAARLRDLTGRHDGAT